MPIGCTKAAQHQYRRNCGRSKTRLLASTLTFLIKKMAFLSFRSVWVPSRQCLCRNSSGAAPAKLKQTLRKELDGIASAGTWKTERVITSPQAAAIRVQGQDRDILNFCANNYLGLSVSNLN